MRSIFHLLSSLFAASSLLATAEATLQVDRLAGIYATPPLSAIDQACVSDLQDGLKKLFGAAPLVLTKPPKAGGGPIILLGKEAVLRSGSITERELNGAGPDGYVIKCDGRGIAIAGADAWATRWGVFAFLEKLGLRYYQPAPSQAQIATSKPTREIKPFSVCERPAFAYRSDWSIAHRESWPLLGDPRHGLNPELFTEKAGSDLWMDHTAGYLVPRALYARDHPEYYAMGKDGKRVTELSDHCTPLCLSNPDVTRIAIERALGWVEKEKEKKFFMITYGDTTTWCQCTNCLVLDPVPGEYSTRLLSWVNPIARAIAARLPDKILMTFAYAGSDAAPPQIRPETNVWVVGSTGLGNVRFWDHAMGAQERLADSPTMKKVDGWLAVAPQQYLVCEYLGAYEPCLVDNLTSRLRYYQQRGLRGVYATYGHPANFSQLWAYLWGRLLWNPDQDAQTLARDYIRDHYRKAADQVIRYFDLSHRQYLVTRDQAGQMTNAWAYPPAYYRDSFIEQALACFAEAEAKAGSVELKRELEQEESQFLGDAASHQPVLDPVPESNQPLLSLLKRSRDLARTPEDRQEFVRSLSALGRKLEETKPGYQNLLADWFAKSGNCGPRATAHQLRFTPECFLWADSGPGIFADGPKADTKSSTPPKACVGVLAHLYSSHRKEWTSSTMEARFQLPAAAASQKATLELEGQDTITKWAGKRELDWKVEIAIALNGTNIFSGESGFARGTWSKRDFAVEPGLLRSGENRLEIRNVTRNANFAGPEFLLASATLIH